MEDNTNNGMCLKKKDRHLELEQEVRKWWDECHVFNAEASDQPPKPDEKFFGTFSFPYMNGNLHLGHAYSLSKLEFAAAYHRLKGANVLLPFGFHCTGMPIKAAADKLRREIERFGNPPSFPSLETEEMSKSTGNFKTLKEAINDFSADATRFTLAETVDGMNDASFRCKTALAAVLRLNKERVWMEEVLAAESSLRVGPPSTYADRVFANEMNTAIKLTEKNYGNNMFREALKTGFHDLQAARDEYRFSCGSGGMNRDLVWRFMDIQTRLIAPICPHHSEYAWRKILKKKGFVIKAGWPEAENPDLILKKANKYLQDCISSFRKLLAKQSSCGSKKHILGLIFVKEEYGGWQRECLTILRDKYDSQNHKFAPDEEIRQALQQSAVGQEGNFNQTQKLCMPFLKFKKDEVMKLGVQALDVRLPFSEAEVLAENLELVKSKTGLEHVEILSPEDVMRAGRHATLLTQTPPSPGSPTAIFLTEDDMA